MKIAFCCFWPCSSIDGFFSCLNRPKKKMCYKFFLLFSHTFSSVGLNYFNCFVPFVGAFFHIHIQTQHERSTVYASGHTHSLTLTIHKQWRQCTAHTHTHIRFAFSLIFLCGFYFHFLPQRRIPRYKYTNGDRLRQHLPIFGYMHEKKKIATHRARCVFFSINEKKNLLSFDASTIIIFFVCVCLWLCECSDHETKKIFSMRKLDRTSTVHTRNNFFFPFLLSFAFALSVD